MHFYSFNIGDYAKKTQHLTNEEDLAYRRALDMYYDTEKPLPIDNIPSLSRRLRVGLPALEMVIAEFFPGGRNSHADEVIQEYYAFLAKQKANGKKGGRPKNQADTKQAKPTAIPPVSQKNPTPSQPETINHKPNKYTPPIDGELLSAWLEVRKAKRAGKLTKIAFEGVVREAKLAGITTEAAVRICCERGWQGFKAEWLTKTQAIPAGPVPASFVPHKTDDKPRTVLNPETQNDLRKAIRK